MKPLVLAIASLTTAFATSPCWAASAGQCVSNKLDPSLRIIGLMEADKLDLNKARLVTQLFLGAEGQFSALGKQLGQAGWPAAPDGPGRLLASATVVTNREWVKKTVDLMCKIAAENDVDWDGWDIDVAADNIQAKAN